LRREEKRREDHTLFEGERERKQEFRGD